MSLVQVDLTEEEAMSLVSALSAQCRLVEKHAADKPEDAETRNVLVTAEQLASKVCAALRRAFPV